MARGRVQPTSESVLDVEADSNTRPIPRKETPLSETKRKPRKRAAGEGSIRYSESKKLWIARVMVGRRLDGKPDIREVTAKTERLCRGRLDIIKMQATNGTLAVVRPPA